MSSCTFTYFPFLNNASHLAIESHPIPDKLLFLQTLYFSTFEKYRGSALALKFFLKIIIKDVKNGSEWHNSLPCTVSVIKELVI